MTKEMIISSSAHETRVAILEEDQVAEIFIERERSRGVVGNLYKGRVSKVLPGMQSAFVDLGLERDGFLYVSDVVATFEEFDRLETDEDEQATGNGKPAGGPSVRGGRRERFGDGPQVGGSTGSVQVAQIVGGQLAEGDRQHRPRLADQ